MTISEATTVRDLLAAYPQSVQVLLGHGMCADCEDDPPPVPLHHFAAKHCDGDVQGLLEQLRRAIEDTHG